MADIRISNLTTASTSASDDYIGIDGSTNGTRKLSAYNPSFGGTGTFGGTVTINSNASYIGKSGSGNGGNWRFVSDDGTTRWLAGLLGSGGETTFSIYDLVNSRQTLALTAAGNAALTGNLTVSGTGTSTFAGNITSTKNLDSLTTETDYGLRVSNTAGDGGLYIGANSTVSVIQSIDPGTTFDRKLAINPTGGNVLVGTTVDSANGKLQLATHTTSAGGIGFGTAISLFSLNSSNLLASAASGAFIFGIGSAGARKGYLYWDTSSMIVGTDVGNLVLDAAGGNVTITNGRSLVLGNSYVAGAPTATGYVTIKDSAGNTYKVLVGT